MSSDVREKLDYAKKVVAERLSETYQHWQVEVDIVMGPDALAVGIEDLHECGETHLDIGFVMNRGRADSHVLWDCVAGSVPERSAGLSELSRPGSLLPRPCSWGAPVGT